VKEFEYGAAGEGYWCYEYMVLQLEDCVDALKVVYPQYDFLFLLDHSRGHDRQREDGLNVEKMSKYFGGKQAHLRNTTIKQEQGYLGPYAQQLQPRDTQFMTFQPGGDGPFWMTPQECILTRKDTIKTEKNKKNKLTKAELVVKPQENGVTMKGRLANLKKLSSNEEYM